VPGPYTELAFEDAIEHWLLREGGYEKGLDSHYDRVRGLDTAELFAFIGATQIDAWNRLLALHGGDANLAQRKFADRVARQIDARGTVDVLRHGVEDLGVLIRLAYFRPASGLNPELEARYAANRLTVTRQLHYSGDVNASVDLALFVNGLPMATSELKNPPTGQSVEHAMAQYRVDRDPRDVLFGRRAVVHFAVDPDVVMMTTTLEGRSTRFLPFNQGSAGPGRAGGAGNPPNPRGHASSYLWEQVWQRHAWLDVLARFVHLEQSAPGKRSKAARNGGTLIFPRFHQWDAVRTLEAAARVDGPGANYLVQHSAGSGKSNTIAWLVHRLASLHDATDAKVFDKVVVITDRRVLDRQLQDTIYQFEHAHGMVAKIDQHSSQLAEALRSSEAKIVITTLQKFPFVVDEVRSLPGRRYAVVIDEAHSSQSGEASKEMKAALAGTAAGPVAELIGEDEGPDSQDLVAAAVEASAKARGRQENLSLFAFTATPKAKTLELFGAPVSEAGQTTHRPFHLYSMRQAIEEGFIMDVLASYTTYASYFRLANGGVDDPEVDKKKAAAKIAAYVSLHPEHVAQKARIIVDHFRTFTAKEIGGKAKAMVVCRSRLHAVRFRLAIDAYLAELGVPDVKAVVAFSGTVVDPDTGAELTEARMNGFSEAETAEQFAMPEHRILVVAEKFQTGFDQPLLHTMFVDKKLAGVNAVQTLSRLNRIHSEKASTFVLDFVNDADEIVKAFAPFYEEARAAPTDPNELFDARNALEAFGVLRADEIDAFAEAWFSADTGDKALHAKLYVHLDPARERFVGLDEDDQEEFRTALERFVNLYAFLAQVFPLSDSQLEKRYAYCRLLKLRLPRRSPVSIDVDIELTHLRVARTGEHHLALDGDATPLVAFPPGGGAGSYLPGFEPLSVVIERFNATFGLTLTEADALHLEGIVADMAASPAMQQQAAANTMENFGIPFGEAFTGAVVDRMTSAEDLTVRLLDDQDFKRQVSAWLLPQVYEKARVAYQKSCPIGDLLARGEDQHLEYKSTLRWDLREGAKSKLVETASLKTVAAFLNSPYGGTLLIGVGDDSGMVGLDHDYATLHKEGRDDRDVFQLHLTQLVANAVGLAAAANVTTAIHHVDGHDVCRVHVKPSGHPVFATVQTPDGKKSIFYVRINNGTRAVEDEVEVQRYMAQRWGSGGGHQDDGPLDDRPVVAVFENGLWNGRPLGDWLQVAVDDIVAAFQPRQVIVFGSVARGEDGPDSDLDLMVVLDSVEAAQRLDVMAKLRRCITAPVPVDVMVTDPEEIERRKDVAGSAHYWPLREGKVVYDRAA